MVALDLLMRAGGDEFGHVPEDPEGFAFGGVLEDGPANLEVGEIGVVFGFLPAVVALVFLLQPLEPEGFLQGVAAKPLLLLDVFCH